MGELFGELCKGPVVVVDNRIGDKEDLINKLIGEIEENNLSVLGYKSVEEARGKLPGLLFSNFIVLDWKMIEEIEDLTIGVQIGAEAEAAAEQEVIEFIKKLQKICLAPIFVLSAYNKGDIVSKLKDAGIITEGKNYVFVESKNVLCETRGALISKIEDWIKESPHIYLAKCWTKEWLSKNTTVFWDLYKLNPNWPALFYRSFEEDGDDPVLALRDTLFQLVFSEIDVSEIKPSFLKTELEERDEESQKESLKDLYKRLVYIHNDVDKNIRPGDIFKIKKNNKEKYYLNIRPECDTTKRNKNDDPELYLLEGLAKKPKELKDRYQGKYGIIPRENEIIMLHLDGNDIVRFDKSKLLVKRCSEMKDYEKICRVSSPFITKIRQSYSSYLGRFGVPSYPKQIVDMLFESEEKSS